MIFDFTTQIDAMFDPTKHLNCPDCGSPMLLPKVTKGASMRERSMLRCIFYPKCRGGKHKADHVLPADRATRRGRWQLHGAFRRADMSPKEVEKWLRTYTEFDHIGEMFESDVEAVREVFLAWKNDDMRVYLFYSFVTYL